MARRIVAGTCAVVWLACGGTDLSVQLVSPQSAVLTNGPIALRATVTGGRADSVRFEVDGRPLVNVDPPYEYTWDTGETAEGVHQLTAVALRSGDLYRSAARTITIDRTPPALVSFAPAADSVVRSGADPLVLTFSEALDPASLGGAEVRVATGGATIVATAGPGQTASEVRFVLPDSVPEGARADVHLAGSVRDTAGNALSLAATGWSFRTVSFRTVATLPGSCCSALVGLGTDTFLSQQFQILSFPADGGSVRKRDLVAPSYDLVAASAGKLLVGQLEASTLTIASMDPGSLDVVPVAGPRPGFSYEDRLVSGSDPDRPVLRRGEFPTDGGHLDRVLRWDGMDWVDIIPPQRGYLLGVGVAEGVVYISGLELPDGGYPRRLLAIDRGGGVRDVTGTPGPVDPFFGSNARGELLATSTAFSLDGGSSSQVWSLRDGGWSKLGPELPAFIDRVTAGGGGLWASVQARDGGTVLWEAADGGWHRLGQTRNFFRIAATEDGTLWRLNSAGPDENVLGRWP